MRRSFLIALVCIVVGLAGFFAYQYFSFRIPAGPGSQNATVLPPIDHISYRKTSSFDPGTIRIYVRNTGGKNLSFKQVLLDGLSIPVWGVDWDKENPEPDVPKDEKKEGHGVYESAARRFSGKQVIWARLTPSAIRPGKIAEFAAKLANPMSRPMKVEFVPEFGDILSAVVRPIRPAFIISAVTFSEGLDTIYVYLEGQLDNPLEITGLEIDGQRVSSGLWISSPRLERGEKQLAVVGLRKPLVRGTHVTIKALSQKGFTAEERVRVLSGLPLNIEGAGVAPAGFELDNQAYTYHPAYLTAAEPGNFSASQAGPSLRGNYIFECAMHTFGGDKRRSAKEILRRYDLCAKLDPSHPSCVHLCRIRPERGYALFAEAADILRINPNITTALSQGHEGESPEGVVGRITRHAYLAARPRPVHSLADTSKFGEKKKRADPAEFRRRIYSILGEGAKGLFYRHQGWLRTDSKSKDLNAEIRRINQEIARVRSHLAIADVVPWVNAEGQDDVTVRSLLAGDKAVLLILIRHSTKREADEDTLQVEFKMPKWMSIGSIALVTPENDQRIDFPRKYDETLRLTIPVPEAASIYLLQAEEKR